MNYYTYDEWNQIIKQYKEDKINIGVELSVARQFLMNNSTKYSIWALIILFLLPFITCISAITIYHFWGILFIIGFVITYSGVCGMASTNFSMTSTIILCFGIFTMFIYIALSFIFALPFILSLITFLMIYIFYFSIGKSIINDYAFHDYAMFCYLLQNRIIKIFDFNNNDRKEEKDNLHFAQFFDNYISKLNICIDLVENIVRLFNIGKKSDIFDGMEKLKKQINEIEIIEEQLKNSIPENQKIQEIIDEYIRNFNNVKKDILYIYNSVILNKPIEQEIIASLNKHVSEHNVIDMKYSSDLAAYTIIERAIQSNKQNF